MTISSPLKYGLLGLLAGVALGAGAEWIGRGGESPSPQISRSVGNAGQNGTDSPRILRPPSTLTKRGEKKEERDDLEYFMNLPAARFPAELKERLKKKGYDPALDILFETWAYRDPQGALTAWLNLPSEKRSQAVRGMFKGWVTADPDAALAYLADHRESRGELGAASRDILTVIAGEFPEKALPWLRHFTGQERTELMRDFFSLRLNQSLEAAMTLCNELTPEEKRRTRALEKIALRLGETDWNKALRWVENQPEEERQGLIFEALSGLCVKDPEAMKKNLNIVPAGEERDQFLWFLSGGSTWADTPGLELDEVLKMRDLFQDPQRARLSVLKSSELLARNNPGKLLEVTNSLPDGELKDTLRANYALRNERASVEERLNTLTHLEGSRPQRMAAGRVLQSWADTRAALKWIEAAPVSKKCKEEWKESLDVHE